MGDTSANGDRVGDLPDGFTGDLDRLILDFVGDLPTFQRRLARTSLGTRENPLNSPNQSNRTSTLPSKSSPREIELEDEKFDRGLVVSVIRPVGDGIAVAEEAFYAFAMAVLLFCHFVSEFGIATELFD